MGNALTPTIGPHARSGSAPSSESAIVVTGPSARSELESDQYGTLRIGQTGRHGEVGEGGIGGRVGEM